VVVDNEGIAYVPAEWPNSRTFWQSNQEKLLVADNQTERYAGASEEQRCALRTLAWGDVDTRLPTPSIETLLAPIVRARHGLAVARLRSSGPHREAAPVPAPRID